MIEVLRAGVSDLVVDQGRPGWGAIGVPVGGAADAAALAAANLLVGNSEDAAGLEMTLRGPALRFPEGGIIALTGSPFAATRSSGAALAWNETLVVAAGETLSLGAAAAGCRAWLAVRGGLAAAQVMGSRSVFLPGEFGGRFGRALRAGDVLETGAVPGGVRLLRASPPQDAGDGALRVVPGPQLHSFGDAGLAAFFSGTYRIDAASDRRGLRLRGPCVTHALQDLRSQGVLPGAVQVPADGQPIILGWDGPVTGGYPVVAALITADLSKLAQLRPGDLVRFETIELERARDLAAARWKIEELA